MLYVFVGDTIARNRVHTIVQALTARAPHASISTLGPSDPITVEALFGEQGLFHAKRIIVLDSVLESADAALFLKKNAADMRASPHVFIVREERMPSTILKVLQKHADKIEEFHPVKAQAKQDDVFGVARAVAQGQAERAWIVYREALKKGAAPEAVHGMVFWQLKQLLLKPVSMWKKERIEQALSECAVLPYKTRARGGDVEHALETFILSL